MASSGELYSFSEEYIENVRLSFSGGGVGSIDTITVETSFYGSQTVELDANNNYELFLNANDTITVTVNFVSGATQSFSSETYTYSEFLTLFSFSVPGTYYYDNKNNFIRWINTEGDGLVDSDLEGVVIVETDIKSDTPLFEELVFCPYLIEGETINWYFNTSNLLSTSVGNLSMFFINKDGLRASGDITGISADVISGSDYRPYLSFTVPTLGAEGEGYRMVVWDGTNIVMVSNELVYYSTPNIYNKESYQIKYRNRKNILNFGYENTGLESYYNQVRIRLEKISPQNTSVETGYNLVNGRFNVVRTTLNKSFNFVTGAFDGFAHDAMHSALIHSDFQIKEDSGFVQYYLGENEYNQDEMVQGFPLTQADFRLTESGGSSNKAL